MPAEKYPILIQEKYKLRLQIIATADDDGSYGSNILPSDISKYLPIINKIFKPAQVMFLFDEKNDYLKINSTILNRDLTPLEPPNVGESKWDHEPIVEEKMHSKSRNELAELFYGKIVVFSRCRNVISKNPDGLYEMKYTGGGFSSGNSICVNLPRYFAAVDLAHEIGHYLQIPHPFVGGIGNVSQAANAIKNYVNAGNDRDDGLKALDGDKDVIGDTPADCRGGIFSSIGLEKCGEIGEINIPVDFGDEIRNYILSPNRNLVMSYFKGCSNLGEKTISPEQARRVRDSLELQIRNDLISIYPSFNYHIIQGGLFSGEEVSDIDVTMVRSGRIAVAKLSKLGEFSIDIFDIENEGKTTELEKRGTVTGENIKKFAICGIGGNSVVTSVITSSNELKLILWHVKNNGSIEKKSDFNLNGEITNVACCLFVPNLVATAAVCADGTLKIDVWKIYANGTIKHLDALKSQNIVFPIEELMNHSISINSASAKKILTNFQNNDKKLMSILWSYDQDNGLREIGSIETDEDSLGSFDGFKESRFVNSACFIDKNSNLRINSYTFPDEVHLKQVKCIPTAESVNLVAGCNLGTKLFVAGVLNNYNKLKLMLWQITKYGDEIIRITDKSTNDICKKITVCKSGRKNFVTALIDDQGRFKLISWLVFLTPSVQDIFKKLNEIADDKKFILNEIETEEFEEADFYNDDL